MQFLANGFRGKKKRTKPKIVVQNDNQGEKKGKNFCAKKKKNSEQVNLQKLSNFGRIQRNLHIFCAKKKCASFLICFRQLYSWHLRFKASLKKKVNVASLGVG